MRYRFDRQAKAPVAAARGGRDHVPAERLLGKPLGNGRRESFEPFAGERAGRDGSLKELTRGRLVASGDDQ
jgi:hypothetical protein